MKSLILMIQFLTRIPIKINLDVNHEDFEKGALFFTVVGILIGAFLGGVYTLLEGRMSPFLLGIVLVAFEVLITGGLHLDGLSDTFDGIYSNRDKARMLEIMKDSRLGANGALALFFFMLLKIGLVMELDPSWGLAILLLMPIVSRLNIMIACRFSKYARKDGMGNFFIGKVNNTKLIFGVLITWSMVFLTSGIQMPLIFMVLITNLFAFYYINHVTKKIDGMTGDTLGALCELSEILFLGLTVMVQIVT